MNNKIYWVDVETTGLDAKRNDIIQLAFLIEIDRKIVEEGEFRVQPMNYATIEKGALEVNKTTVEMLRSYPEAKIVYPQIIQLLDKYIDKYNKKDKFSPAGYNVGFDVGMLKEFFLKNHDRYYGSYFDYHTLDVYNLVYILEYKGLLKLENYKLETVAKYLNIELDAHNALADIRATREVFQKLLKYIK